jgi:type I restriction-modification system DNA methylase subunit
MQVHRLSEEVLTILSTAEINGLTVRLTCGKLDRKLYLDVNMALEALGGKWNRKTQGHDFSSNPTDKLENAILTAEVTPPNKNGYFPTPKPIVQQLIKLAEIQPNMTVLEPSAGQGAIADEIRNMGIKVYCAEILPENLKILQTKGHNIISRDIFAYAAFEKFDRIVMNPPFENQADIEQINHVFDMLKPKGILVSVMAAGVVFRQNKKTVDFRNLLEKNKGKIIKLPQDSFAESGTMVNTVIMVLPKN